MLNTFYKEEKINKMFNTKPRIAICGQFTVSCLVQILPQNSFKHKFEFQFKQNKVSILAYIRVFSKSYVEID